MNREQILEIAKPILFNTEMVRATLDSRKSVTRRLIKLDLSNADIDKNDKNYFYLQDQYGESFHITDFAPIKKGNILYVRETWNIYRREYCYKADSLDVFTNLKWRPSIHMPKEAARIFLKVTDVRIERLQDITPEQADKEGVGNLFEENIAYTDIDYGTSIDDVYGLAKEQFAWLWNSTIKKADLDKYGWYANPYVWVIDFEKVEVE